MPDTRYEEYASRSDTLPFVYIPDLVRTPETTTKVANWHDNPELQFCLSGNGTVFLDGAAGQIGPGDFVFVSPFVIHRTVPEMRLCYVVLIFDPDFLRQMGFDPDRFELPPHFRSEVLSERFLELDRLWHDKTDGDGCRTARLMRIVLDILIELRASWATEKSAVSRESAVQTRVRQAITFIRANYARKLSLQEIASAVSIDRFTLSREFRAVTCMTVVQYINHYRCKLAADAITSGMSVSEAAYSCGFFNLSFFSRTFRACFGVLPSEIRKDNLPDHFGY